MGKLCLLAVILISFSCSKKDQSAQVVDTEKPVVKVYYPSSNEAYQKGGQLCLKAVVEDNSRLVGVYVSIFDKSNAVIKKFEFFPESNMFVVDLKYTIPDIISERFTLEFEAHDYKGNFQKITLPLNVNQ